MSRLALAACLVGGWVLLWGDLSVGNVVAGILVVLVLNMVFPTRRTMMPRIGPRPVAVASLVWFFARQLVVSNLMLTRELLRRRTEIRSHVVDVPMVTTSPSLLTMVTNLAALSPGLMVVDASEPGPVSPLAVLTVHVLVFDDDAGPAAAINSLHELEARAIRAFGSTADLWELAARPGAAA